MDDADDDTSEFVTGLATPPLSPTKSTSTGGWTSPRTPTSPRKTQSCLFFRDGGTDHLLPASPVSPKKPAFTERLGKLQIPDFQSPKTDPRSPTSASHTPVKTHVEYNDGSPIRRLKISARSSYRSASIPDIRVEHASDSSSESPPTRNTANAVYHIYGAKSDEHSSPNGNLFSCPSTPDCVDARDSIGEVLISPLQASASDQETPPTTLRRLRLRFSSSPLRPSQWVTRGGLLPPPRGLSRTPDRFISSRRPPTTTRESFELTKPSNRLTAEGRVTRDGTASADPFSRRLHRSSRMIEELQSLREAHSVITGQANLTRRGANLSLRRSSFTLGIRQVSVGAVWSVGGSSAVSSDTVVGVSNGRGGMLGSGTNAPLYTSMFLSRSDPEAELEAYERRLALAFDVNRADRVLEHFPTPYGSPNTATSSSAASNAGGPTKHVWRDNAWTKDGATTLPRRSRSRSRKPVPILPFRYVKIRVMRPELTASTVLDAPQLRDDYYCSLLAYSHTAKYLAVGLGNFVHLWSERKGVDTPESLNSLSSNAASDVQHVTSLAFSSVQGGQAILAVGRANGRLALWSPYDSEPRFNAEQPKSISYVSFRPTIVKRPSLRDRELIVPTEELLVGDEAGHIYFYSVEWPNETDSALFGWHGALTLLARMTMHSQQICGLSWSVGGELFASGGNDNVCFLFETKKVLQNHTSASEGTLDVRRGPNGENIWNVSPGRNNVLAIEPGREKHKWELNAAVKAISFCPWQRGLLAIGGGSNDRCIHFYHTVSGACLATIDCAAQVTSLIWSTTRREIAATFGFAQPEHPFRIAVFTWPSCEQIVAIPWFDENRALFAIPYPGGPNMDRERGEDGVWSSRGTEEGCIVVAASDAAIRFHEIWTEEKRSLGGGMGLLGGSDILESLHGIEKEGDQRIR